MAADVEFQDITDGSSECTGKQEKILLFLSNNEIFVWDKDAAMELRRKYRIVGSLVGSLPSKPRQNVVFSLPLVLLPEEARLLIDKSIARIVESESTKPDEGTIRKFQDERKASIQEQITRLGEIKVQKLEDFAEIIEEGRANRKRKIPYSDPSRKQLRIDAEERQSCTESNSGQISNNLTDDDSGDFGKQSQATPKSSDNSNETTQQESTLVCVSTQARIPRTKDINWKFPETEMEQARYKVFSDLWENGYYLTNGNKFGGDYLVYTGDPFRFHSHIIVKILPSDQRLSGLDLVSIGRLGSTVKKTSVLASVDSSGNVNYISVQWSGFS